MWKEDRRPKSDCRLVRKSTKFSHREMYFSMHDYKCLKNIKNEYWKKNIRSIEIRQTSMAKKKKKIIPTKWGHVLWGYVGKINRKKRRIENGDVIANDIADKALEIIMRRLLEGEAFQLPAIYGGFIVFGKKWNERLDPPQYRAGLFHIDFSSRTSRWKIFILRSDFLEPLKEDRLFLTNAPIIKVIKKEDDGEQQSLRGSPGNNERDIEEV